MEIEHPIDKAVRDKLRDLAPNQTALAHAIGRSQGWVSKYLEGGGTATIDDVIRIAAAFIGANAQPLTELERRLLKAFRSIPERRREDAVAVFEPIAKRYRLEQPQESNERAAHTHPATSHKGRGKR